MSYDNATLKVTELFSKAIPLQMLSVEIAWLCAPLFFLAEITKSTHLKWCPHTFVYKVYLNHDVYHGIPSNILICLHILPADTDLLPGLFPVEVWPDRVCLPARLWLHAARGLPEDQQPDTGR